VITPATQWKEYGFKAKPGDTKRMPPQIAPYHLRLDWLIWFLPFSVAITGSGIRVRGYDLWFLRFVHKLLTGDPQIRRLMGKNPFPENPPVLIRALFYRYRYTDRQTKRQTGAWWTRELLGTYLLMRPCGCQQTRSGSLPLMTRSTDTAAISGRSGRSCA
jgi:Lipase maturation factor